MPKTTGRATGRAYKWDSVGGYQDLGDLNGIYAGAWDINDSGVITGNSFYNSQDAFGLFTMHAFRWENGTMTDLAPPLADGGYSRGIAINESGVIAGRAAINTFTGSDKYAAQYDAANNFTHFIAPGNYSNGKDINDLGVMVGIARAAGGTASADDRAAIWDASGNLTIFGTLGGDPEPVQRGQ